MLQWHRQSPLSKGKGLVGDNNDKLSFDFSYNSVKQKKKKHKFPN